jgi:serine phosphatase RsbU (regulator of sigma subunit)
MLLKNKCLKKQVCIVFVMFLFSFGLRAENDHQTDSLINLLSKQLPDTLRVKVLNEIARNIVDYPDSSLKYAISAEELSKKTGYEFGIARSISNIGEVYNAKGNYNLALKNFYESYHIYEQLGNKTAMNKLMNSIGNTHMGNKDYNKALEAFRKCYELGLELKDTAAVALSSFGIGNTYGTMGKMDSAMKYLNYALPAFSKQKNNYGEAMTYALIGQLKNVEKKYAASLNSLGKAMVLFKQINQLYGIGVTYQSIGKTYYDSGDKKKALENYLLAYEAHLKRNAYDNLKESCENIAEVYKDLGDYKKAFAFHEKFMNYKDSVFNDQSRKQLLEVETEYQTKNKEEQIRLKNLELEKSRDKVKNRTAFLYVFIGVSVLFLVMGFFVFMQYKQKQKANVEIMHQKNIIEEKNKNITDSIRYAQYIQESILPDDDMIYQLLHESFVLFRPKDIVSGDFYWVVAVNNYIYIAVVDCTGHGVPGAFMSMVGHNGLSNSIKNITTPSSSQILSFLQEEVKELFKNNYHSSNVRDGMDISLVRFDRKNMQLQFSGANNPVCIVRDKKIIEYKGDKVAISAHYESKNVVFTEHKIDLQKSDTVYLFSDGYADQFGGPKGKKFKYKQLQELLAVNSHLPMIAQKNVFEKTIDNWKGDLEQIDDILIIGFRV